ncbi:hypothetical protein FHETE_10290 [Fusarium heterosporum]|uniref:Heterokaryon incompatibility domain-containing protein n=1 Tax=Fusarium heterosporum TaxID=42747 RepID=A0A8H5SQ02_FUSHE|nr:hypothetical protein FHETE_10290 [Fusarium heterosporum]
MDTEEINLCSTCDAIDFEDLFYSERLPHTPRESVPSPCMGTLQEILDRAEACQVCRLIIDMYRERYKRWPTSRSEQYSELEDAIGAHDEVKEHGLRLTFQDEPIKCYLERQQFFWTSPSIGDESQDEAAELSRKTVGVGRVRLVLDPCPWSNSLMQLLSLQVIWPNGILHSEKRSKKGGIPFLEGTGRKVNPVMDFSLPRHWIHQCEKIHGDKCSKPKWLDDNNSEWPRNGRVIDVKEGKIVDLLPETRYIALSYVWGSTEKAKSLRSERRLTRENSHRLRGPKGLEEIPIPQTIKDAMNLVWNIGERFLWVDALCIMQDDPEDVSHQTGRMDLIYSKSLFTILAACGKDSESGLAGSPSNPRQIFQRQVEVSPCGLHIVPCVTLSEEDTLQSSAWNSRGWTFQERLLSRRALVFTNSQVYWCCDGATWDEESILDIPGSKEDCGTMTQRFGCYDEWEESSVTRFSEESYGTYITQFSERQFTFPSDALPAFLGIIRRYEQLNNQKLHWGLSTVRFDQALMWKYGQSRRRELYTYISDESVVYSVPYPSWSWLGWNGFIGSNGLYWFKESQEEMGARCSILTFYSLMSDGSVSLIDGNALPSKEDASGEYHDDTTKDSMPGVEVPRSFAFKWKGETEVSGPVSVEDVLLALELQALGINKDKTCRQSSAPYDTGRIVFWTSHIKTMVSSGDNEQAHIDAQGQRVNLKLCLAWEALHSRHSFSEKVQQGNDHTVIETQKRNSGELKGFISRHVVNLIVISRYLGYSKGEETEKLNLMAVEEKMPGSGVWSRIGFGVIAEEEWAKLNSDWRLVVLE